MQLVNYYIPALKSQTVLLHSLCVLLQFHIAVQVRHVGFPFDLFVNITFCKANHSDKHKALAHELTVLIFLSPECISWGQSNVAR